MNLHSEVAFSALGEKIVRSKRCKKDGKGSREVILMAFTVIVAVAFGNFCYNLIWFVGGFSAPVIRKRLKIGQAQVSNSNKEVIGRVLCKH